MTKALTWLAVSVLGSALGVYAGMLVANSVL